MKKNRGLYHVSERRYLNFSSGTFSESLVIFIAPTVILKRFLPHLDGIHLKKLLKSEEEKRPGGGGVRKIE
jgi:hypothetical protein